MSEHTPPDAPNVPQGGGDTEAEHRVDKSKFQVEEKRRQVQQRLLDIGRAADREMEKAERVKDAAMAVFGIIGGLLAARRVARMFGEAAKSSKKLKRRKGSKD